MENLHLQMLSPDFGWGEVLDDVTKIQGGCKSILNPFSVFFPLLLISGMFSHISTKKTTFLMNSLQSVMSDTYKGKYPC